MLFFFFGLLIVPFTTILTAPFTLYICFSKACGYNLAIHRYTFLLICTSLSLVLTRSVNERDCKEILRLRSDVSMRTLHFSRTLLARVGRASINSHTKCENEHCVPCIAAGTMYHRPPNPNPPRPPRNLRLLPRPLPRTDHSSLSLLFLSLPRCWLRSWK